MEYVPVHRTLSELDPKQQRLISSLFAAGYLICSDIVADKRIRLLIVRTESMPDAVPLDVGCSSQQLCWRTSMSPIKKECALAYDLCQILPLTYKGVCKTMRNVIRILGEVAIRTNCKAECDHLAHFTPSNKCDLKITDHEMHFPTGGHTHA